MLRPSDRAPGLLIGEGVVLPDDVEIGGHVVIHAGTTVEAGARIQDLVVLGKPVALGPRSRNAGLVAAPARVGAGSTVCAGAVVAAGALVGTGAVIGDQAQVRERAVVGASSVIGRGSAVDNDVIVGDRVRVQTGCYLTAFSIVEDDVFVAPGVITMNDNTMGRHGRERPLRGARLGRASRIGGGAKLLPGVHIGEEAFVAAGSVVTRDVAPRAVVLGVPARQVREVGDEDLLEAWT